jgi:predicted transcriptional regulator of viral defense system
LRFTAKRNSATSTQIAKTGYSVTKISITPRKLTRASDYALAMLSASSKPIFSDFELFSIVHAARNSESKLGFRKDNTLKESFESVRRNLRAAGAVTKDPDYVKSPIWRNMNVPNLPAEDIVCLADTTACVSHLSAMQRWGLTDRSPRALIITQPERAAAMPVLFAIMQAAQLGEPPSPVALKPIRHPTTVRNRPLEVVTSKILGRSRVSRGTFTRVATIGQTFLDMVQNPELCGGMSHVLDVWEEHARVYVDEIVEALDECHSDVAKSRAGYIFQERLGIKSPKIEKWKLTSRMGTNRKLDPNKEASLVRSLAWNLDLNV